MARRRRRNGRYDVVLLLIGGLLLAPVLLQWLLQLVAAHPVAAFLAAAIALGLVIVMTVLTVQISRQRHLRRAELDRNVAVTDEMSGKQFEQYIARLMRRDGLHRIEVCGGSGDLGADVTAYTRDGRRVEQCSKPVDERREAYPPDESKSGNRVRPARQRGSGGYARAHGSQ